MKICIVSYEVRARSDIRNYSGGWSFYLARELRALGVEVSFHPASDEPAAYRGKSFDHVIVLGTFLSRCLPEVRQAIRGMSRGALAQVRDRGHDRACAVADVTFCVCAAGQNAIRVGWAADPEVFLPSQGDLLTVLIDHPKYGDLTNRTDFSAVIQAEVAKLAKRTPVRVMRLVDGGVVDIDPASDLVPEFTRQHIPLEQIAKVYGQAHLFMVTHAESVGQTALETALSGALPVVPDRFIDRGLLKTVRYAPFTSPMDWPDVLAAIDPPASRAHAMRNTWQGVASRVALNLSEFRR
jgi:hypothetical protein